MEDYLDSVKGTAKGAQLYLYIFISIYGTRFDVKSNSNRIYIDNVLEYNSIRCSTRADRWADTPRDKCAKSALKALFGCCHDDSAIGF